MVIACLAPQAAHAIPAFARRTEMACTSCHQGHFPQLNALGRLYRENGYQLPDGAEAVLRSKAGTGVEGFLASVPLSARGQVYGLVPVGVEEGAPPAAVSLASYVMGGGAIVKDVSYFFSWTPFPTPMLHHARVGVHNLFADALGGGSLNVRAGAFFLLDFQRPGHRHLFAAPAAATTVKVGRNTFVLEDANLGVEAYGRPLWGPFHYEVALVAGDMGGGIERDDGKDVFARGSYTVFHNTDHELSLGAFGYLGSSVFTTTTTDLIVAQRDDFWLAGGDAELDLGPVNLFALAYARRDADPDLDGVPVLVGALRGEALWTVTPQWVGSLRYELVTADEASLNEHQASVHLSYVIAPNALVSLGWRHYFQEFEASSALVAFDGAF
ncbi:MAG: hypothetical protein A2138_19290 [Deltaproteobacteria bacterium RBG_16_71_12]|nr:MAG: hypothetical protein A2138_19290 [Deltaproteobacteria bacterium RBG_16_71_12]